jgi:hypothetical protein
LLEFNVNDSISFFTPTHVLKNAGEKTTIFINGDVDPDIGVTIVSSQANQYAIYSYNETTLSIEVTYNA